ncbi:MAG TPA: 1,2-phenylacetyl-CoA epoxidase subunit PaaD [Geminicoccaceae bacterium]|nr:1,2-phenylacetyl-CoA epoxidase subunit PaaD [Geminicoccaceae bacterium]
MATTLVERPSVEQVRNWLAEVPDPEIPVISVIDLGIVRDVRWQDGGELVVTVTPTYSGCPATAVISLMIEDALRGRGLDKVRLERRIAPPWTTDWISSKGREQLKAYGVAPPAEKAGGFSPLDRVLGRKPVAIECPRCGSTRTAKVSEFGSTPCKAQYRCQDCLEPFDYFKCI